MKIKRIKIPIYVGKLIIISVDDFMELKGKFGLTQLEETCDYACFTFQNKDNFYMIFKNGNIENSFIVHESVHITNMLFDHINMTADFKNDEPQAYFTEWIFEQCEKFFKK